MIFSALTSLLFIFTRSITINIDGKADWIELVVELYIYDCNLFAFSTTPPPPASELMFLVLPARGPGPGNSLALNVDDELSDAWPSVSFFFLGITRAAFNLGRFWYDLVLSSSESLKNNPAINDDEEQNLYLMLETGFDDSFGILLSPVTGCLIVLSLPFIVLFRLTLVWLTSSNFSLSSFFLPQHPEVNTRIR